MNHPANLLDQYDEVLAKVASREDILLCADQIPPLPQTALKVLELLNDLDTHAGELADVVSMDTRLTTALLKLAHSPAYPHTQGVLTVMDAVAIVGANHLRSLTLTTSLVGLAKREAIDKFVWDNSMATAIIARRLAEENVTLQPDELFILGLLHCLGQFVFLANPKTRLAYARVLRRIRESGVDYATAELEEIGFSHNLIGALVAHRWNFPSEICHTILNYTEPFELIDYAASQKPTLIKLADLLAHAAFTGHPPGYPIEVDLIEKLASALGFKLATGRGAVELIKRARRQLEKDAALLAAPAP